MLWKSYCIKEFHLCMKDIHNKNLQASNCEKEFHLSRVKPQHVNDNFLSNLSEKHDFLSPNYPQGLAYSTQRQLSNCATARGPGFIREGPSYLV